MASKQQKKTSPSDSKPSSTVISMDSPKHNTHQGKKKESNRGSLPLVATDDIVAFPHVVTPFPLRKKGELALFRRAQESQLPLGIVGIKKEGKGHKKSNLYPIGSFVEVLRILKISEKHQMAIVESKKCFKVLQVRTHNDLLMGEVEELEDKPLDVNKKSTKALISSINEVATEMVENNTNQEQSKLDLSMSLNRIENPLFFMHHIASHVTSFEVRQELLAIRSAQKRAEALLKYLMEGLEFSRLKEQIQQKFRRDINKEQKEMFLRKQIKVIQSELEDAENEPALNKILHKAKRKKWSKEVKKHFNDTVEHIRNMQPYSHEYANQIRYANFLVDLPWGICTEKKVDLQKAEKILNRDHYGLEKVKERILEFIAVHALRKGDTHTILCLLGPPGVGKTTIAASIAETLQKKYVKVSLAGLHDEAKLMGHSRTYVGSKEGAILAGLRQAGSMDPVFLLDEIDKMDRTRSAGSESILSILDPSQQKSFKDNYMDVSFDISKVLFIATANDLSGLSRPLIDRMEIIDLEGYALEEKIEIAESYLLPKEIKSHGLQPEDLHITKKALQEIIASYTSESGVRELSRQLGTIARKVAKRKLLQESYPQTINPTHIKRFLDIPKFDDKEQIQIDKPGKAIGLSWSEVGGGVLAIEASAYLGKGEITLSGQLGKVMQESARVALSLIKTQAEELGINPLVFKQYDLHIHSAPGFVSKEGPSAGITLAAAMASLYTQRNIKNRVAMTGEITLQGHVRPVGGIKEKVLAAKRAGIKEIVLNTHNKKHVDQIKKKYLTGLTFHYVDTIEQAFGHLLTPHKIKNAKVWKVSQKNPQ